MLRGTWGHDKPVGQAWAHRPLYLLEFSGLTRSVGETKVYVLVNGAYTLPMAKVWGVFFVEDSGPDQYPK